MKKNRFPCVVSFLFCFPVFNFQQCFSAFLELKFMRKLDISLVLLWRWRRRLRSFVHQTENRMIAFALLCSEWKPVEKGCYKDIGKLIKEIESSLRRKMKFHLARTRKIWVFSSAAFRNYTIYDIYRLRRLRDSDWLLIKL